MFAGFPVVLLVEAAHQILKDGAHGVVVQTRQPDRLTIFKQRFGAEVDFRRQELADQRIQGVGLRKAVQLIMELELVEDVRDVGREAVQIGNEVPEELLPGRPGDEVPQGERRGVIEGLAGSSTASRRRSTVMGRMASRYLPRKYKSRSASSATDQMKLGMRLSWEACMGLPKSFLIFEPARVCCGGTNDDG